MNLSRSSVNAYLPYTKIVYKAEEVSLTAERLKVFRARKRTVEILQDKLTEEALWEAIVAFSDYPFCTAKKLKFKYEVKGNEMFVGRKEKSITRSTVELAFQKAMGGRNNRPKEVGSIWGKLSVPGVCAAGNNHSHINKRPGVLIPSSPTSAETRSEPLPPPFEMSVKSNWHR